MFGLESKKASVCSVLREYISFRDLSTWVFSTLPESARIGKVNLRGK